jgi:hypothetical protein
MPCTAYYAFFRSYGSMDRFIATKSAYWTTICCFPAVPVLSARYRGTVCGAYDGLLYQNQLEIRELQRAFDTVSGELRSLLSVPSQGKEALTLEWIAAQRLVLEEQRRALQAVIEEAERRLFTSDDADELTLKAQEQVYIEVQRLQADLGAARQERDNLTLNIADSVSFIASLEHKLKALSDSAAVAEHIGEVRFQYCPACYSPLEPSDALAHVCHLCKTPFDKDRSRSRIVAIINDTAIQLKQSQMLQERRQEELERLDASVHSEAAGVSRLHGDCR